MVTTCQPLTGGRDANSLRELFCVLSHHCSLLGLSASDSPSNADSFFPWHRPPPRPVDETGGQVCTSMMDSARSSRACRRSFSCRRRAFSAACGSALRSRRLDASPSSSPRSRCRRQFVRYDEYKPSRLSSAPNSPGCVQAYAACKMRNLYAALNLRWVAFGTTSGLGTATPIGWPFGGLRSVSIS